MVYGYDACANDNNFSAKQLSGNGCGCKVRRLSRSEFILTFDLIFDFEC